MDLALTPFQQLLQQRCCELAVNFATHSTTHNREASHPSGNYQSLHEEGFLALMITKEHGDRAASLLDHTIVFEALGAGCPSTALASVVMPILESSEGRCRRQGTVGPRRISIPFGAAHDRDVERTVYQLRRNRTSIWRLC
jgi:hypothetical protein